MGIAASSPEIIHYMNAVKPPYNVSTPTAYFAYQAFTPASLTRMHAVVEQLKQERARLLAFFASHQTVERIRGGVDANFLLVQLHRPDSMGATKSPFTTRNAFAEALYKALAEDASENVVVRYRGNEPQCEGCLRVSVGTLAENDVLMRKWDEHARRLLA